MAVRYPLHLLFLPCQLILSKDTIWNQFLPYLFSISELPDQICSGLKPKQGFCAECSAWHLKLKLCSSCSARHRVSSHGAGTSPSLAILVCRSWKKKKKIALQSTQILLSENWICIQPNFSFSLATGKLWCFWRCFRIVQVLQRGAWDHGHGKGFEGSTGWCHSSF